MKNLTTNLTTTTEKATTWEEWKHNFCQHISDWSYAAADEELEKMRSTELNNKKREIVEMIGGMKLKNEGIFGIQWAGKNGYNQALDDIIKKVEGK